MPDFADLLPDTPHLAGWHRNGTPILSGNQAEWRVSVSGSRRRMNSFAPDPGAFGKIHTTT